jgi:lactoylglutathione lyase
LKEVDYGKHISLGFEVKSVDEMMKLVKEKGIAIHSGPIQPNPHTKFFHVLDPNGLRIQFVENI